MLPRHLSNIGNAYCRCQLLQVLFIHFSFALDQEDEAPTPMTMITDYPMLSYYTELAAVVIKPRTFSLQPSGKNRHKTV